MVFHRGCWEELLGLERLSDKNIHGGRGLESPGARQDQGQKSGPGFLRVCKGDGNTGEVNEELWGGKNH